MSIWRRRSAALAATAMLAVAIGACGDDDDDTASPSASGDGASAEGASAEFCEAADAVDAKIDQLFNSLPQPEGDAPPGPEFAEQAKAAYNDVGLDAALDDLEASLPTDIEGDVRPGIEVAREFGETGDPSGLEDPAFEAAGGAIDEAAFECPGAKVEAAGIDYAFQDLPTELDAGTVRAKFENRGTEAHELVLVKPKAGETESLDQILAKGQEYAEPKVDAVFVAFAAPGETAYGTADLEAGEYLAVCFIPKGSTSPETEGDGPPHFVEGMRQPVTVA